MRTVNIYRLEKPENQLCSRESGSSINALDKVAQFSVNARIPTTYVLDSPPIKQRLMISIHPEVPL